jgi:hypothetical protein
MTILSIIGIVIKPDEAIIFEQRTVLHNRAKHTGAKKKDDSI